MSDQYMRLEKIRAEILDVMTDLDIQAAENAELRERLACAESACSFAQAEANKYLEQLAEAERRGSYEFNRYAEMRRDRNSANAAAEANAEERIEIQNKLAATEALLAEWVAWVKQLRSEGYYDSNDWPPMPKEKLPREGEK